MSVYVIALVKVNDEAEYQKYVDNFKATWPLFNGKRLVSDFNSIVIEGEFNCNKVIMLEFPNEEEYKRWYESPEYQKGVPHRHKAADSNLLLVHGVE